MINLPLASIGAFLLIAGQSLGISTMMGVLMLVGIVLTNAIVLIDLAVHLIKEGMSVQDALIESGRTRIRPISMTAITTMIAMLPPALGMGEGSINVEGNHIPHQGNLKSHPPRSGLLNS